VHVEVEVDRSLPRVEFAQARVCLIEIYAPNSQYPEFVEETTGGQLTK